MARLARLSRPRGAEIRRRPYIVRVGNGCEVRRYKGEVLIALVLVLNITPLAIIYAVAYTYNKWLKIKCLIGWPKLSRCIQKAYSFGGIYILRGGAIFLKGKVVVQSFKISALFATYIGSLVSSTSSTVNWRYLSISYTIYPHSTTQLQLGICYRRQL